MPSLLQQRLGLMKQIAAQREQIQDERKQFRQGIRAQGPRAVGPAFAIPMAGLGQDLTDSGGVDPSFAGTPAILSSPIDIANPNDSASSLAFIQQGLTPTSSSVSSTSDNGAANLLAQLSTMWTKALAPAVGQSISPTTQVTRNADGSYSIISPGSSSAAAGALLGGTASSSSLLLIGGLVIAGLVLMSVLKNK